MNRLKISRIAALALGLPLAALAQQPGSQIDGQKPGSGAQTRAWLEAQYQSRGDEHTSRAPMPGEVAGKVYQRYVDSFAKPQPAEMPRGSFSSGSSGSGG